MATREEIADAIAGLSLFADLSRPQLLGVASRFEESFFPKDARVLRQGLTGSGFYVILDGEADVIADVVATRPLRCIVLAGRDAEPFLIDHPRVLYRMLQTQSRRLRAANERTGQATA